MSIIAVFNQKGGVGKTTTSVNLAAALARRARIPYGIDLDPQAHFTSISGLQASSGDETLLALFQRNRPIREVLKKAASGLELVPSHMELSKVDTLFGKGYNVVNRLNTALKSERFLDEGRPILIDCSPLIGVLSLNAIFACQGVIIPVSADHLSAKAALQVDKSLRALETVLKHKVPRRFLLTRFDARRKMAAEIFNTLSDKFGEDVCQTRIAENVSLAESPAHNQSVFEYAPNSRGAQDYDALVTELTETGFLV